MAAGCKSCQAQRYSRIKDDFHSRRLERCGYNDAKFTRRFPFGFADFFRLNCGLCPGVCALGPLWRCWYPRGSTRWRRVSANCYRWEAYQEALDLFSHRSCHLTNGGPPPRFSYRFQLHDADYLRLYGLLPAGTQAGVITPGKPPLREPGWK